MFSFPFALLMMGWGPPWKRCYVSGGRVMSDRLTRGNRNTTSRKYSGKQFFQGLPKEKWRRYPTKPSHTNLLVGAGKKGTGKFENFLVTRAGKFELRQGFR